MATEIPTHADIRSIFQTDVLIHTSRLTDKSFSPGTLEDLICGGGAAQCEEAILRAVQLFLSTFVGSATGEDLDALASDHFQLTRFGGQGSIGTIRFSRVSAAFGSFTIPALTVVETPEGIQFATLEDVLMTGLTVDASIQCMTVGQAGEVEANTITVLSSTLDDTSVTVSNPERLSGGVERETDAKFRERIRGFFPTLRRGTRDAVVRGALDTPGVVSAAIEETSKVADLTQVGICSTTEGSEVNGAWIAKGTRKSVKLVITYTAANMANGETVTLNANLQDATSSGGAGAADFGAAIVGQNIGTAPGAGGPHLLSGQFEQLFDVQTARAFLRSQQTLTTSGSGTIIWSAALELQGQPSIVRLYIADASGNANSDLIDAVEENLLAYRSAGVEVEVLAATVVQQAITLVLTFKAGFDTSQLADAAIRAVFDYVSTLTIGETLFRSKIIAAAASIDGIANVTVPNPPGDVVAAANQKIATTLATITLG